MNKKVALEQQNDTIHFQRTQATCIYLHQEQCKFAK